MTYHREHACINTHKGSEDATITSRVKSAKYESSGKGVAAWYVNSYASSQ